MVGPYHRIVTRLFDKRLQPAFASLPIVRYIPSLSNVNESAKHNIITGQFHRLSRCVTNPVDFAAHMSRIVSDLCARQYSFRRLFSKYKNLLTSNPEVQGPFRNSRGGVDFFMQQCHPPPP